MTKLQWFAECRSEAYLMNSPDLWLILPPTDVVGQTVHSAQVDICVSTIVGILCNSKEFRPCKRVWPGLGLLVIALL